MGAIAIAHLIKQPYLEVEVAGVSLRELQVNDFPNIQIDIRLEGDARLADIRAHTILGNLVPETLADDTHWYADYYPVFPAPIEWKQSSSQLG